MARRQDVQDAGGIVINTQRGAIVAVPMAPGTFTGLGIPVNGIAGFAPSCIWNNLLGSQGTLLYLNIGTVQSALWVNVDFALEQTLTPLANMTTTNTLSPALNAGRTNTLNASGGFTTTLPSATGSGNIYKLMVGTVSTTGYVVSTNGTDVYKGWVEISTVANPAALSTFSTATLKNITLNGTTTGGVTIGDILEIQDIAANVWAVNGFVTGSGTIASPFS